MIRYFILLILISTSTFAALDYNQAVQQIKVRNGDIYILVNPETGESYDSSIHGLWRFIRGDDYPDDTKYKRQHTQGFSGQGKGYSGLTVDKFARVYVFREDADNGKVDIMSLTNKLHPQASTTYPGNISTTVSHLPGANSSGACEKTKDISGSPVGWVYVIEDDGSEGWLDYYTVSGSGKYTLTPRITLGDSATILPPAMKSMSYNYEYNAHGGFWGGTGATPAIQINGAQGSKGTPASMGGASFCGDPNRADGGTRYAEWSVVPAGQSPCGKKIHPSIGAFFMVPARSTHSSDGGKGANYAAARICSVKKESRKLFFDRYITSNDYSILTNSQTALGLDTADTAGLSGNGMDTGVEPISVSVGMQSVYARYNHCGDMCGAPGQAAPTVDSQAGKAVGVMSSHGLKDSEQRKYVLKQVGAETAVMKVIGVGTGMGREVVVNGNPGNWGPSGVTSDLFNVSPLYSTGEVSVGPRDAANEYIINAFGSSIGWSENKIKSVQVSKRTTDKDWVYISNPANPQFFRVSESFWGTGGIMWFLTNADQAGAKLIQKQVNHETGVVVDYREITLANSNEIVAFGADGDGYIYWLEKSFSESLDDLTSLLGGNAPTWNKIVNSGKLLAPAASTDVTPPTAEGYTAFLITVKREAGLQLRKSYFGSSSVYNVGVVPTGAVQCQRTFVSYSGDPGAQGSWDGAGSDANGGNWMNCDGDPQGEPVSVELAVINVANPPISNGNFVLDITDVPEIAEGQKVRFFMENPPRFNGPYAQLAGAGSYTTPPNNQYCSYATVLRAFDQDDKPGDPDGYVKTVANMTEAGSQDVKDGLRLLTGSGYPNNQGVDTDTGRAWTYEDSDSAVGMNPSFLYEPIPDTGDGTCNQNFPIRKITQPDSGNVDIANQPDNSAEDTWTLRYRWMVTALTPPMGLKMNHPNVPNVTCIDIESGQPENVALNRIPGLIYGECFHDVPKHPDVNMAGRWQTEIKSPPVEFPDPGVYKVTLELKGLRWVADNLTFNSDSSGVTYEVTSARADYILNVHPQQIQADGHIHDVAILNEHAINSNLPSAYGGTTWNGTPFVRVFGDHMEVVENKPVPIVAEATIDWFQAYDKAYMGTDSNRAMTKYDGVGSWDHNYPGTSGNHDKRGTHPSNFTQTSSTNTNLINIEAGNDATSDYESNLIRNDAGQVQSFSCSGGAATCNSNHKQGTYSTDSHYSTGHMGTAPEAMFDWYEIKYYWFLRYKNPADGSYVGPFLLRSGNLSEIWALQNFATPNKVDEIAPQAFQRASGDWLNGELIKRISDPSGKRVYKVRIPLFEDKILTGTGNPVDRTINWQSIFGNANFVNIPRNHNHAANFDPLITPFKFPVPTDPSALEFSFYIDYPTVKWAPRNPQNHSSSIGSVGSDADYNNANTLSRDATYYDLVYWGPASKAVGATNTDPVIADYARSHTSLASSSLADPRFDQPLNPFSGAIVSSTLWGNIPTYLDYSNDAQFDGGIGSNGIYSRPNGSSSNHWYDVIIRDNTPPTLSAVSTAGSYDLTSAFETIEHDDASGVMSGETGGRLKKSDGFMVAMMDNNPYQHWKRYDSDFAVSEDFEPFTPVLQQMYYELGSDPRNLTGLGLLPSSNANPCVPGFFIQEPLEPSQVQNGMYSTWSNQLLRPIEGESYFRSSLQLPEPAGNCDYYFPNRYGFGDRNFISVNADGVNYLQTPYLNTKNVQFARPVPAQIRSGNYTTAAHGTGTQPYYAMQFAPRLEDGIPTEYGAVDNGGIRFIPDSSTSYDSLDGTSVGLPGGYVTTSVIGLPFQRDAAYRVSYWWLPQDAFVMPYYMRTEHNGDINDLGIFAKGYDVSRMDLGLAREDVGIQASTLDQAPLLTAARVGSYSLHDNRPPNLKITFYDYKENSFFKILLLDDYAMNYGNGNSTGNVAENAVLLRTADTRPYYENDVVQDNVMYRMPEQETYRLDKPTTIQALNGSPILPDQGSTGNHAGIFNVKIPEDVRFLVKVEAVDNSAAPDTLSISIGSDMSNAEPVTVTDPTEYPFPEADATLKVYQYQAFKTQYHHYPKAGFFDVIRVSVSDPTGNKREVFFPIQIIKQEVYFNQLGQEMNNRY